MPARNIHTTAATRSYQPYYRANAAGLLNKTGPFPYPAIGIYCGPGASHSWLWFVDVLEAMGFFNLTFITDQEFSGGGLARLDALLVSGGDTFAIAHALGEAGARELERFVTAGGVYIGSCAGAYLPLTSSLPPLNLFNYVSAKISNLAKNIPAPSLLPEKFCTPYGCRYVFHPVREEVRIRMLDFPFRMQRIAETTAPLYGGPAFLPSEDAVSLAVYSGFTSHTLYLSDPQLAHDTLVGKAAIIAKRMGGGTMFLAGPHLEHPRYPAANTLIAEMLYGCTLNRGAMPSHSPLPARDPASSGTRHGLLRKIQSELSNARIAALALEHMPLRWQIGCKLYEPEKIRVFLEGMWSRRDIFASQKSGHEHELCAIYDRIQEVTRLLKCIQRTAQSGNDDQAAAELFERLKALTASYLAICCAARQSLIMRGGTT